MDSALEKNKERADLLEGNLNLDPARPRLKSQQKGRHEPVLIPLVGERYTKYMGDDVDKEFLQRGEREVVKYCQSINGRMTQDMFELFVNENVTKETIQQLYPYDNNGDLSRKVMYLHRRYYKDENGLIRDQLKDNRVIFNPIYTFDMIMGCHLLNSHPAARHVHQGLWEFYANVSRDLVEKTVQFCTKCNPEKKLTSLVKVRSFNVHNGLLPLERVHFEIFEPYPGELIEGKYSHVLYCRDYYSRFLWMMPLKSTKFKRIVPKVAEMLLLLPRLPIFIESTSLNWQDMFDVFETIAKKYSLDIGLGTGQKHELFHVGSLNHTRQRFLKHKKEGIKDWNMLLLKCCNRRNYLYDIQIRGVPANFLSCNIPNLKQKFRVKRSNYMYKATGSNIVKVGKGCIYLEVEDENENNENEERQQNQQNTTSDLTSQNEAFEIMNSISDSDDEVMIAKYKDMQSEKNPSKAMKQKTIIAKSSDDVTNTIISKKIDNTRDMEDINGDTLTTSIETLQRTNNVLNLEQLPQSTQEMEPISRITDQSCEIVDSSTAYIQNPSSDRRSRDIDDEEDEPTKKKAHLFVTGDEESDISREP